MSALVAVFTTVGSEAEAQALATALVEQGLAACAQISAIESCYRWQGTLQHDREWGILFKTAAARAAGLQAAIAQRHGYELPAIWTMPIADADPRYAQWVLDHSGGS